MYYAAIVLTFIIDLRYHPITNVFCQRFNLLVCKVMVGVESE
jgi:hypothetical protein